MRTSALGSLFLACGIVASCPSWAADKATRAEAVSMVKKAVAFMKAKGRNAAIAEFNSGKGQFIDRELYIFVLDKDGTTLANGVNQHLIGKNVMQLKDIDGKYFIKQLIAVGDTKGTGWVDYTWSNPTTHVMEDKQTYLEKVGKLYIGCGIYK